MVGASIERTSKGPIFTTARQSPAPVVADEKLTGMAMAGYLRNCSNCQFKAKKNGRLLVRIQYRF